MAAEANDGVLTEADLRNPERGAELDAHDPFAAADGLEPPELKARLLAWIGVSAVGFVVVAMILLYGVYRLVLANAAPEPVRAFPTPRLETSINPRIMPAQPEPGPAPYRLRQPSPEPPADMDRAMRTVVARGARAYDPMLPAGGDAFKARTP